MAALTTQAVQVHAKALSARWLQPYASLVFSARAGAGLAVLLASATRPQSLLLGPLALLASVATQRGLRLASHYSYEYNALLCGLLLAHGYEPRPAALLLALALGALSACGTAALTSLASHVGQLPVLSLPFVACSWFVASAAPALGVQALALASDPWAHYLPRGLALILQSFGAFVLAPNVVAGACVWLALFLHSRIAGVLGSVAIALVVSVLGSAAIAPELLHAAACCAGLTAVSIGGIWLVPSRSASCVALASALLAAFFALGLAAPLARLGLSLGFVPFNVATLWVIAALRQRADSREPRLALYPAESPEQQLQNDISRPAQPATAVQFGLPFYGAWTCTQGADGSITHRGVLRHAYDFEIYSAHDGSLCGDSGLRVSDYHCFQQPIIAAADGVVIAIENAITNNAIGESDVQRPWGNYVVLQHAPLLFSVVAHLAPGTVIVYPGQTVVRGSVLGYCGSSGRSPRPHLHFQLQLTAALGSQTIPCHFSDVVATVGQASRYEPAWEPQAGETLRTLLADYALGSHFALPEGASLSYKLHDRIERVVSEYDAWGRCVLRSIDLGAALVFAHDGQRFSCAELTGPANSVLRLIRLALGRVPFERQAGLSFRTRLPERWLHGGWKGVWWELMAPFSSRFGVELSQHIELEPHGLSVVGVSRELGKDGTPLVQTRARFTRELGPSLRELGPSLIEVSIDGRVTRAEQVRHANAPARRAAEVAQPAGVAVGLGAGEWS